MPNPEWSVTRRVVLPSAGKEEMAKSARYHDPITGNPMDSIEWAAEGIEMWSTKQGAGHNREKERRRGWHQRHTGPHYKMAERG